MNHPYTVYERTALWQAIDTAITELVRNQDLSLTTAREYVVGYLCEQLSVRTLVTPASVSSE